MHNETNFQLVLRNALTIQQSNKRGNETKDVVKQKTFENQKERKRVNLKRIKPSQKLLRFDFIVGLFCTDFGV